MKRFAEIRGGKFGKVDFVVEILTAAFLGEMKWGVCHGGNFVCLMTVVVMMAETMVAEP